MQTLLHLYTGERHIVVGAPYASREMGSTLSMIGCFAQVGGRTGGVLGLRTGGREGGGGIGASHRWEGGRRGYWGMTTCFAST